ncbi:plasmid replication protein RepC [Roseitranquillus sediminis]|uniref:plasmid replication protein RepC n=1 Tax=Roseitranquillus sediminis TaxID=2809051 RepID=UPI001D0CD4E3|nr:plasmid replication protein RepC [Roseitranquillus sediminis]MBM9595072.1 replication initiation protein RepC [Roseitranquillus sediminis]
MEYTPLSPFLRPISRVHLRTIQEPEAQVSRKLINKWELLRELSKAQTAFDITERDLRVLQGLLSFFPDAELGENAEMIVFPSNKAICERLNGMPCSTMRRHLAKLVGAGLVGRRDSPNGKRYVRKHGDERVSFGFDLSPLFRRSEEIARAAVAVRDAENRLKRLREVVSLMRRDLAALAEFGEEMQPGRGLWDQLRDKAAVTARALRRKLSIEDLGQYRAELEALIEQARNVVAEPIVEEVGTNDAQYERHHHNSKTESTDLEPSLEEAEAASVAPEDDKPDVREGRMEDLGTRRMPKIPLHMVTAYCQSLKTFHQNEIRHWHQLYDAACRLRSAMGITASAWEEAQRCMGREQASIVVVAMLERFTEIRSPGGYLRALSAKCVVGKFSCGPMVMALSSRRRTT